MKLWNKPLLGNVGIAIFSSAKLQSGQESELLGRFLLMAKRHYLKGSAKRLEAKLSLSVKV